jgi:hypothetical protein
MKILNTLKFCIDCHGINMDAQGSRFESFDVT